MPAPPRPLELSELIDLELRFATDRELDPRQLLERDEAIGKRINSGHTETLPRHAMFRRWLAALRDESGPSTGEQVQAGYRLFGVVLGVSFFLLGAGAARAVLAYDGTQPVNVVHFLAVFVAAQLALVGFAVFAMMPHGWLGGVDALGPLQEAIRMLTYRRSRAHDGRPRPVGLARVGALGVVYGRVERWMLLALTQRTAFFFNVGALLTCLYLITFTDLAFAWSTTLDVDAETMTRLLRGLALPWSWLHAAVPTPELVATSRYFRSTGSYDPRTLKDWWAFLLAALITYGLLPRLVLWRVAAWRTRRLRALLALDHGDAQIAYERMMRGTHGWVGHGTSDDGSRSTDPSRIRVIPADLPPMTASVGCTVVRWADVPLNAQDAAGLTARRFGWRADAVQECGGRGRLGDRDTLISVLAKEAPDRPLVLLAESWEAPSRAVTGFLAALRRAVGARRPIVVALLDARDGRWSAPTPDDRDVWERTVAQLADPYVRVEPVITQAGIAE